MYIYEKVAKRYRTKGSNVERCIRNAIGKCAKEIIKYFKIKSSINNSLVIAMIHKKVKKY